MIQNDTAEKEILCVNQNFFPCCFSFFMAVGMQRKGFSDAVAEKLAYILHGMGMEKKFRSGESSQKRREFSEGKFPF